MSDLEQKGPSCLFIIDVQNGFVRDVTSHIPALVEALQDKYEHVIATRFYNPPGSLYRSIIHWERFTPGSSDVDLAYRLRPDALIIDKAHYSCVDSSLLQTLKGWGVTHTDICGIDTDICVSKTAVDLFEAGIVPRVLSSNCASHGGADLHEAALRILRRFIGASQVV